MEKAPFFSIVMFSRNDNYHANTLAQLQACIDNLIDQAKRYHLSAELIIVEWNSPADRPLLKEALRWPDDLGGLIIRFIVVPPSIHESFKCPYHSEIIPPAASNVGIRRAKGEFIITTNADILLSEALIQFLVSGELEDAFFYRAVRHDVHQNVLKFASSAERIEFCEKNIQHVYLPQPEQLPSGLPILQSLPGDFVLFKKEYWHLVHGYPEIEFFCGADMLICYMAYLAGLKEKILPDPLRIYHINHLNRWRTPMFAIKATIFRFIKVNVWNHIPIDGRLRSLIKSAYVFQRMILQSSRKILLRAKRLFLKKDGDPIKQGQDANYFSVEYKRILVDVLTGKRSFVYNDESWGLPDEKFTEFIISSGHEIGRIN